MWIHSNKVRIIDICSSVASANLSTLFLLLDETQFYGFGIRKLDSVILSKSTSADELLRQKQNGNIIRIRLS